MRPSHLALLAAASIALVVVVILAFANGPRVLAADPDATVAAVDGVGPGGDLAGASSSADGASNEARATRTAIASAEPAAAPAPVVVAKKASVHGRIVDPSGRPVPGARVWATTSEFWARVPLDLESEALPSRWVLVVQQTADADGRFAFEELKPGRLRFAARSSGFAPAYREDLGHLRERDLDLGDIALPAGVAVAGVVLGPDGKPAAGVAVLIAADSLARGGGVEVPGRGVPATATDERGAFRVDELAPGPFHLLFLAEGCALAELSGRTERAGQVEDGYVVHVGPGVEIAGVIKPETGTLPANLRVVARRTSAGQQNGEEQDEQTDGAHEPAEIEARPRIALVAEDGSFTLRGLRANETYRLTVGQKRGEQWKTAGTTAAQEKRAPVGGVEFLYKPETAILARVVDDATSLPLEDLVVWAGSGRFRPLRDEKNEVQRVFPLGAVRCAELGSSKPSKPAWLKISAPGYQDHERKDLRPIPGQELDLGEIRLKREFRVVVTVVDAAGLPVEKARVILTTENADRLREWSRMPPAQDLWGESTVRFGRTAADGTCTLSSLPGKRVLVQASGRGFVPCEPSELQLSKDSDHALALTLAHGARVLVRVRDGAGRQVPGVPVGHRLPRESGQQDGEQTENVVTDARGESSFDALEAGVHAFRVQQEDGESTWFERDDDADQREEPWQEVTLASSAEVTLALVAPARGTLVGAVSEGGRPLEGAVVKLVPYVEGREAGWTWGGNGQDPFSSTTDHRGEYRIENRRAGEYVALVHHAERRMPKEQRVLLGPGEQVQDFVLDLNSIEGRVTDPDGRPFAGVSISIDRAEAGIQMEPPQALVLSEDDRGNPNIEWREGRGNREARTDAQGHYVLRGLVEESALRVSCRGDEIENKTSDPITLGAGESRHGVDFVVRRAGRIKVELAGTLAGDRWYEMSVIAKSGETESVVRQMWLAQWNRSEIAGSFVPGTYVVRAVVRDEQGGETRLGEKTVEVAVGTVASAVFQVP